MPPEQFGVRIRSGQAIERDEPPDAIYNKFLPDWIVDLGEKPHRQLVVSLDLPPSEATAVVAVDSLSSLVRTVPLSDRKPHLPLPFGDRRKAGSRSLIEVGAATNRESLSRDPVVDNAEPNRRELGTLRLYALPPLSILNYTHPNSRYLAVLKSSHLKKLRLKWLPGYRSHRESYALENILCVTRHGYEKWEGEPLGCPPALFPCHGFVHVIGLAAPVPNPFGAHVHGPLPAG